MGALSNAVHAGLLIGAGSNEYRVVRVSPDVIELVRTQNGTERQIPRKVLDLLLQALAAGRISIADTGRDGRDPHNHVFDRLGITHDKYIMGYDSTIEKLCEYCLSQLKARSDTTPEPDRAFVDDLNGSGVRVDDLLVTRLLSSLLAKRFLLLTGLSGSGKTKLAQALAVWLAAQPRSEPRYALLAVGANWTSKEDLLGYPDALNAGVFRAKPALELLLRAKEDPKRPYFLILDEMNLSHVERYFSDFLSAMESGEEITLHEGGEWQTEQETPVPEKMVIPANLFVIGTVNVDETTYMFSPKVLDRANVIEFRAEAETVSGFLGSPSEVDLEALAGKGDEFAEAFAAAARMRLGADFELEADVQAALKAELEVFFAVLADHEAEFGFRTAKDVARFVHFFLELSGEQGAGSTEEGTGQADSQLQAPGSERLRRAMDAVVMQKILPKLHGSERKLGPVLRGLGELCHGRDGTPESRLARARAAAENQPEAGSPLAKKPDELFAECRKDEFRQALRYPLSFEKIVRMLRKLRRDGFASFAEA